MGGGGPSPVTEKGLMGRRKPLQEPNGCDPEGRDLEQGSSAAG